jgi:hypothetical protein
MKIHKTLILLGLLLLSSAFLFSQAQKQVDPVNWRELIPFLIDIPEFEADGKPEGSTVAMGNYKVSQAEREYSSGDKELKISIVDGAYAQMAYAGIKMAMNFEMDTSEEYVKKVTIKGFTGIEKYEYEDKDGQVILLVADRFVVQLEEENAPDTSELKKIAEALDLEGLAKLAK